MKKKHRDIVVNGKTYGWLVSPNDDPQDANDVLKIYFNKKLIHSEDTNGMKITPAMVAEKIPYIEDYFMKV